MITIGIPVLRRPHNAAKVYASIVENTTVPYEIIWVVSPGDREQHIACMATPHTTVAHATWDPGPADFARKHALAFSLSHGDWYFAGADDLQFMAGWDIKALKAAEGGAKVIGTNDLANPTVMRGDHATHILFNSEYVREVGATWHDGPGAVYSTAYDHQRVDDEAVACAKMRGVWAFAKDSHVKHHHPVFSKNVPMDAVYSKALAKGLEDGRVFMHRRTLALREASRSR